MPSPVLDAGVPFRFLAPTPLRWVDVDSEGVVNNAVYLSLMEQARFLYFEQLGVLPQDRLPFVLADARTTFLLPGRLRMDMATAARVCRLGRSSFDMVFEVRGNGTALVRSSAVLVWVGADLRPVPIDPVARMRMALFEGIGAGSDC